MKLPNKVITYKESTISKFPVILSCLKEQDMSPASLYKKLKTKIEDIGEYIGGIGRMSGRVNGPGERDED